MQQVLEHQNTIQQEPAASAELPIISESSSPLAQIAIDTLHQGDVIDRLPAVNRRMRGARVVYSQYLSLAVSSALAFPNPSIPAAIIATGVGASLPFGSDMVKRCAKRGFYREQQAQLESLRSEADLPVELFRKKDGKHYSLDLRLYDAAAPADTEEWLLMHQRLQQIIRETGAESVTVPESSVNGFLDEGQLARVQRQPDWLASLNKKSHRRRVTPDFDESMQKDVKLISLSPTELSAIAGRIENYREQDALTAALGWLRQAMPNHPAVTVYDKLVMQPDMTDTKVHQSLSNVLGQCIERRLTNAGSEMVEVTPGAGRVHRQKYYLQPRIKLAAKTDQPVVAWIRPGRTIPDEVSDLFSEHNISEEQLQVLLDHPESLPTNQRIELCELAAWLYLEGHCNVQIPDATKLDSKEAAFAAVPVQGLQERLLTRYLAPKQNDREAANIALLPLYRRSRIAAVLMLASIVAAPIAILEMDRYSSNVSFAVDNNSTSSDRPLLAEQFLADNWNAAIDTLRDNYYKSLDDFQDNLTSGFTGPFEVEVNGSNPGGYGETGGVGNLKGGGDNLPSWQIEPNGNISSEGYWSRATFDELRFDDDDHLYWSNGSEQFYGQGKHGVRQIASMQPPDMPSLAVAPGDIGSKFLAMHMSGDTAQGMLIDGETATLIDINANYVRFNVPVLEGTMIAAAQVRNSDQQLRLTDTNGQQYILAREVPGESAKLQAFWLVEDDAAPVPTATGSLDLSDDETAIPKDLTAIWIRAMDKQMPVSQTGRLHVTEAWIRDKFAYKLDPLKNENSLESSVKVTTALLKNRTANCNLAATLLALANPHKVAPTSGFYNENSVEQQKNGRHYLSTREAHMWTVDGLGVTHDATPPSSSTEYDQYFAENFDNEQIAEEAGVVPNWLKNKYVIGGSSLAAAAIVIANRRRLARAAYNSRVRAGRLRGRTALSLTSDQQVVRAHGAMHHAIYAPKRSTYIPEAVPSQRLPFQEYPVDDAQTSLYQWSQAFEPGQLASLGRRKYHASRELRRDMRTAERIARNMQRIDRPLRTK